MSPARAGCAAWLRCGEGHEVRRCPECGVGATEPRLGPEALGALHASAAYRAHGQRFSEPVQGLRRVFARGRVRRLGRFSAPPGILLDVGCGDGAFLLAARKGGWRVFGAELDEQTARFAREGLGFDVRSGPPEAWGLDRGCVDAVTLWHVLEHAPDPASLLAACCRLLRPGGTVAVAVPNLDSFQARLTGCDWFHLDVPYHAWHFTPRSLERLLGRSGLELLEMLHWSAEYGPFGFLQSLMNAAGCEKNALFGVLREGGGKGPWGRGGQRVSRAVSVALAPLLLPPAALLALAESGVRRGGCITAFARRSAR